MAARAKMIDGEQPTGIIKSMPHDFIFEEYGAKRFIDHFFYRPNQSDNCYFIFSLLGMPKYDVLHFYLLVDKRIRFRANIISFEGESTKNFGGGRVIHGRAWVNVGAPVVRAPFPIPMTGFRGFRYTPTLF
jgi:hypothetical protein